MIKVYSSILAAILLSACSQQQSKIGATPFGSEAFTQQILLECEPVDFADPVLRPVKLAVVDSFLILINAHTGTFIQRFNLLSLEQTGEFIDFGSGPDEMIAPIGLFADTAGVSILDGAKQELFMYSTANFCLQDEPSKRSSIRFDTYVDNMSELSDGRFVGTVRQEGYKRLTFYDSKGSFINTEGIYPFSDLFDSHQSQLLLAGSSCSLITNEQKTKICIAYMLSDLIEIYDSAGQLLKRVHGPDQFLPEVASEEMGEVQLVKHTKDKTRDAYFSPVSYRNEIYVLYSGRMYDPDNHDMKSDQILVFDWDGTPQRSYTLATPIYAFTIDPQKGVLYGLSDSPEFHVIKAKL